MPISRPTKDDVAQLGADLHLNLTTEQVSEFHSLMGGIFDAYDVIDALPNPVPEVEFPRSPGTRPHADQNKLGAWACKTEVKGAPEDKLAGWTSAILEKTVPPLGCPQGALLAAWIPNGRRSPAAPGQPSPPAADR